MTTFPCRDLSLVVLQLNTYLFIFSALLPNNILLLLISTLAVDGDVVLKNQIRVTNKAKQVIEEEDEQVVNELKNQIANLSMVILNKKEHMKNLLARLNDMIDKM